MNRVGFVDPFIDCAVKLTVKDVKNLERQTAASLGLG